MADQTLCPCDKKMTLPGDTGTTCPYCGKVLKEAQPAIGKTYGIFGSKKNFIIFIIADTVITLLVAGIIIYFTVFKQ